MPHIKNWSILLVIGGICLALADDPDTSPTSDSQKRNPISWQSAFMGLIPLALNSMTQPSTLDVTFPQSNLLFPARSSPIICLYDILWIIIELYHYTIEGNGIREAALRTSWDRVWLRLGAGVTEVEDIPYEKHPKTFAILFVGTFLQALKLWAVHGLFWTKVWAGLYISSYVVVAGLGYLAPLNWRDERPHPLPRTGRYDVVVPWRLAAIAVVSHMFLCMWTIHCVVGVGFGTSSVVGVLYSVLKYPICLALFSGGLSLWAYTSFISAMAMYRVINFVFRRHESDYGSGLGLVILYAMSTMLIGGMVAFGAGFKISAEDVSRFFWQLGDVVLQGGGILLLGFITLLGFLYVISALSNKVVFLQRFSPGRQTFFVAFAFANFLLAFLYYRFRFDPTGTEKLAWAENLG